MKMKMKKILTALTVASMALFLANCATEEESKDSTKDSTSNTITMADGNTLTGTQTSNVTIPADTKVVFKGAVKMASGTTLTIGEGATIYGDTTVDSLLIIDRGAKIEAVGTAAKPITFTSPNTTPTNGDWGGIVINGYAHYNGTGGNGDGEGDSGTFGGGTSPNNTDNSGTLQYVRVLYAGKLFGTENELNGIAFQAVGSGTKVSHVQVHKGEDDAMEFFGGTVNVDHIVSSYAHDDNFDWTGGWTGTAEYVLIVHSGGTSSDPRGIEGDNNESNFTVTPVSAPTLNYFSIIGDGADVNQKDIFRFRRGTKATVAKMYVANHCAIKAGVESNESTTTTGVTFAGITFEAIAPTATCGTTSTTDTDIWATKDTAGTSNTATFLASNVTSAAYNATMTVGSAITQSSNVYGQLTADVGHYPSTATSNWMSGWVAFE